MSGTFSTFHCDCLLAFFIISIFFKDINHLIPECKTFCLIISSCFTKCHNSNYGIFISCMCTYKAAITFLKTKFILICMLLFKEFNLFTDKLKSCKNFYKLYIVFFCNCISHICWNNSLNKCTIFMDKTAFFPLWKKIFCNKHTWHVTCKWLVFTTLNIFRIYTKSVCIRVCCKNNICINFFCKL